jgi:hypothetical protein
MVSLWAGPLLANQLVVINRPTMENQQKNWHQGGLKPVRIKNQTTSFEQQG